MGVALCASVLTQYNSAGDTSLGLRSMLHGDCRDVYATPRLYSDAQFLFRELPGLDGSAGSVSLMPAATDGFFLCAESSDSDRIVVTSRAALSPSLCTFRKVAGLSNPALVSFEQRRRYVGYAREYSYDCAMWFLETPGWTVGLVERPSDARLATWVASQSSVVSVYVQDTYSWLCELSGSAVFVDTDDNDAQCQWDVVAALGTDDRPSSAVSLRLRNTSLFLGVAEHESPDDNDSAALPLRVHSCAGTERLCVWTANISPRLGNFFLSHVASGLVVTLQETALGKQAVLLARQRNATLQTLGFWRSGYARPTTPNVVVVAASSRSGDGSSGSSSATADEVDSCAQRKTCQSCASVGECSWCPDTGLCLNASYASPHNCSLWLRGTCTTASNGGAGLSSLYAQLVGVFGCVAVLACAVTAAFVARWSLARRSKSKSKGSTGAQTEKQSESADFVFVSREGHDNGGAEAPTEFLGVTPDVDTGVFPDTQLSGLNADSGTFASESLAPLSLTAGPCLLIASLGIQIAAMAPDAPTYNSAWETSLGLRSMVIGTCRDLYATPRVYSDAQFLFREMPGLDGSADGVSLMPAPNDGFFLCAEGNDTDRLVFASRAALSPSLCTFRKVAGLSNPALVSFEQRGRYVAYAREYSYDCAAMFARRTGWTVGLVERPADARLATWVVSQRSVVSVYVQDTRYWLCDRSGSAVFVDTDHLRDSVQCQWDVVAALGTDDSPSSAVSLRLRNTSLFLGVAEHESPGDNDSAALPLRVHSCAGTERLCIWTADMSPRMGDLFLTHVASGLVVTLQETAGATRAVLLARQHNATPQTLGFWRCASSDELCGWCADTGLCLNASSAIAPQLLAVAQRHLHRRVQRGLSSLVVPLVGVVCSVAVVVGAAATVAIVVRVLARRSQGSSGAPTHEPSASADFVFVSREGHQNDPEAPTEFLAVTPDLETGVLPDSQLSGLSTFSRQFAGESLAPLSLASGPCLPMANLGIHFAVTSDVLTTVSSPLS
eukprot:m51a1_g10299 hypothetical protein (1009) ;mRNA; r:51643-57335